ncbi:unnamed protein product [Dicrocoelium dendriticum]|nr:unnamed protein product [Dicrocoelium dendriticum]
MFYIDAFTAVCPGGCGPNAHCIHDADGANVCVCNLMYAPDHGIPPPTGSCRLSPATITVTVTLSLVVLALMLWLTYTILVGSRRRIKEMRRAGKKDRNAS